MDFGPIIVASIAAFSAILGSLLTYKATRPKHRAEAEKTEADTDFRSAEAFQLLVREMRQERNELMAVVERQGEQIERQSEQITSLKERVSDLTGEVRDLMARWRRGEPPPAETAKGNR